MATIGKPSQDKLNKGKINNNINNDSTYIDQPVILA